MAVKITEKKAGKKIKKNEAVEIKNKKVFPVKKKKIKVTIPVIPNWKDYDTEIIEGTFDKQRTHFKVVVVDPDGNIIDKIDNISYENGYGTMQEKAMEDFIRRNSSAILDKIFNKKG